MAATDGSSAISETKRSNVTLRDGGLCVLCGEDPVDVAHIVAQKAGDPGQVSGPRFCFCMPSATPYNRFRLFAV